MLFPTTTLLAVATVLLGVTVEAQNPKSVQVRSYPGNNRCNGASNVKTVRTNNACQTFQGGARSYEVNRDDDDCFLTTFADANCQNRVSRRDLDHDDDNDDDDDDCERLPRRAQSFRVRCFRDFDD